MQIEVIYNHGRIEFSDRIRFARQRFKVRMDVPDEEIEVLPVAQPTDDPAEVKQHCGQEFHPDTIEALEQLEAIKQSMLAMPDDQFPEITEDQEARISAFRSRENR